MYKKLFSPKFQCTANKLKNKLIEFKNIISDTLVLIHEHSLVTEYLKTQ